MDSLTNRLLKKVQNVGLTKFLAVILLTMYKLKGKDIKGVKFVKELNVWEFKIGQSHFYSSGPGWVYDYPYLLDQFRLNLGYHYTAKEGDCIIDVGAGVGEELMIFSKGAGPSGKVIAIEAHPVAFKVLEYNKNKNELNNVDLLNVAVSDRPGYVFIEDHQDSLANNIIQAQTETALRVEAVTLDQIVDQFSLERVDFMKVNIEGAEQLLIKGMETCITKIRNMAISCHDFRYYNEKNEFFKTKALVIDFLKKNNFEWVTRSTGNSMIDDYIYAFPKK